jgi:uncharacterized membrane protein
MSTVEHSIVVNKPVHTVYNQWTQFEEFPRFMSGVEEVKQLDDRRTLWHTNIGGKRKQFEADITEQIPDQRIAWRSHDGNTNAGVVTFHRLSDDQTRVMLQMSYEPDTTLEKVGDMIGMTSRRIEKDLENFKDFIETRGSETGAWRGTLNQPHK